MFSIPLTYLNHVYKVCCMLISTVRRVEPRKCGVCTLIRHGVDQNRENPTSKHLEEGVKLLNTETVKMLTEIKLACSTLPMLCHHLRGSMTLPQSATQNRYSPFQ